MTVRMSPARYERLEGDIVRRGSSVRNERTTHKLLFFGSDASVLQKEYVLQKLAAWGLCNLLRSAQVFCLRIYIEHDIRIISKVVGVEHSIIWI